MVPWYHAILSAYGFWLPNDPRGSWSDFVFAWELFRFGGPSTKVIENRNYAHDPHDVEFRREMKKHLKYKPARFDESCRKSIGRGFARACTEFDFQIHACAIGYDHVHMIVSHDDKRTIDNIGSVLKARATSQMKSDGTHPMRAYSNCPTPWAMKGWYIYVHDDQHLHNAIDYVERHPMKEGMPRQSWDFVKPLKP